MVFEPPSEIGLSPTNPDLSWEVDVDTQFGQIIAGKNCFVLVNGEEGLSYIRGTELIPLALGIPTYEDGYAYIDSFDSANAVVNLRMVVPIEDIDNYPFPWMSEDFSAVYISTPSKTNGDYMRGHYMSVYLSNASTTPVECLAFNVNYEPTKLDHSLGQNA